MFPAVRSPSTAPPPSIDPIDRARWLGASDQRRATLESLRAGERVSDLRGIQLAGESLVGLDLSMYDLRGADLTGADLSGARLMGANLAGAILREATLTETELAGANLAGAVLDGVKAARAGLGQADLRGASCFGAELEGASLVEAKLRRADLRTARLDHCRLVRADLSKADLGRARLCEADLTGATVTEASFAETDLRHAVLRHLVGFARTSFLGADLRDVDFSGAYLLRRHILDENFLAEFRAQGGVHRAIYWVWWVSSDCGRSLSRWGMWILAIVLAFGALYANADVDYGDHPTWLSPYYFSVVTLTTLGYGDALPASVGAQVLVIAEVAIGYMMLGGMISIFSNKFARRGSDDAKRSGPVWSGPSFVRVRLPCPAASVLGSCSCTCSCTYSCSSSLEPSTREPGRARTTTGAPGPKSSEISTRVRSPQPRSPQLARGGSSALVADASGRVREVTNGQTRRRTRALHSLPRRGPSRAGRDL